MSEIENLKIYGGATYTVGNQDIIANEWEAGVTYVKGKSYVIREHKLYVCNVTHTSVEPFDVTKWTEITVGEAIAANTTAIGTLSTLTTSVTSSLVGAVNEVNGKKITVQAIVADTALTTTPTDYNTISSRKFSDYDLLLFKMGNSLTDTRRTVILPSSVWSSGWTINEGVLHGSSASTPSSYQYSSFSLTYKSDTSITALVSGSGTIAHLAIYGLKLST